MFLLLPGCMSLRNPTLLVFPLPSILSSPTWFSFFIFSFLVTSHGANIPTSLLSFSSLYSFRHLISPPLPAQYTTQNSPSLLTSTHHHPLQTSSHNLTPIYPILPGHNCLSRASPLLSFSFSSSSLYTARTYALLPIATSFNTTCYSPSSHFSFSFFVFHRYPKNRPPFQNLLLQQTRNFYSTNVFVFRCLASLPKGTPFKLWKVRIQNEMKTCFYIFSMNTLILYTTDAWSITLKHE